MPNTLNGKESQMLWDAGVRRIGEEATIWRDHEHESTLYPRTHTDALLVKFEGNGRYVIIAKEHVS